MSLRLPYYHDKLLANPHDIYRAFSHELREAITSIHAVLNLKKLEGTFDEYDAMYEKNVYRHYERLEYFTGLLEDKYERRKLALDEILTEVEILMGYCLYYKAVPSHVFMPFLQLLREQVRHEIHYNDLSMMKEFGNNEERQTGEVLPKTEDPADTQPPAQPEP